MIWVLSMLEIKVLSQNCVKVCTKQLIKKQYIDYQTVKMCPSGGSKRKNHRQTKRILLRSSFFSLFLFILFFFPSSLLFCCSDKNKRVVRKNYSYFIKINSNSRITSKRKYLSKGEKLSFFFNVCIVSSFHFDAACWKGNTIACSEWFWSHIINRRMVGVSGAYVCECEY